MLQCLSTCILRGRIRNNRRVHVSLWDVSNLEIVDPPCIRKQGLFPFCHFSDDLAGVKSNNVINHWGVHTSLHVWQTIFYISQDKMLQKPTVMLQQLFTLHIFIDREHHQAYHLRVTEATRVLQFCLISQLRNSQSSEEANCLYLNRRRKDSTFKITVLVHVNIVCGAKGNSSYI